MINTFGAEYTRNINRDMRVVVRTPQSFQHKLAIVQVADRFHSANTFLSAGQVWLWLSAAPRRS
jgi:hypothetical protein